MALARSIFRTRTQAYASTRTRKSKQFDDYEYQCVEYESRLTEYE